MNPSHNLRSLTVQSGCEGGNDVLEPGHRRMLWLDDASAVVEDEVFASQQFLTRPPGLNPGDDGDVVAGKQSLPLLRVVDMPALHVVVRQRYPVHDDSAIRLPDQVVHAVAVDLAGQVAQHDRAFAVEVCVEAGGMGANHPLPVGQTSAPSVASAGGAQQDGMCTRVDVQFGEACLDAVVQQVDVQRGGQRALRRAADSSDDDPGHGRCTSVELITVMLS